MKRELQLAPDHESRGGIYHCLSRVVWREFIFGAEEKGGMKGETYYHRRCACVLC